MGILAVLDENAASSPQRSSYAEKVEYHLVSWGEIYAPFSGNREHSRSGRIVLDKPPFELVSISEPYSPLPQKLCLRFTAPIETRPEARLTGVFPHEAAQEFAALLSVLTRRRVFAYQLSRSNGWPVEEQFEYYEQSHSQERQRPKELEPTLVYDLMERLRTIDRPVAERFVVALRFYHAGVRMMYTEPEFAYLFLVICLEAIATLAFKEYVPEDRTAYLKDRYRGWEENEKLLAPEARGNFVEMLLRADKFVKRKVVKFVEEHVPDSFWDESQDDSKPYYVTGMVGPGAAGAGQLSFKESECALKNYERFSKAQLRKVLGRVYSARSKLLHSGINFPSTIVVGLFTRIPAQALTTTMAHAMAGRTSLDVPPLLTFERLVSRTLVNYLQNMTPTESIPGDADKDSA